MQVISTKFIGPTNHRGSRVAATAQAGRVVLDWDHALNPERNHAAAARALADKFGWEGRLIGGDLPSANSAHMAFVFDNAFAVEA
jgi:hypothetical protein